MRINIFIQRWFFREYVFLFVLFVCSFQLNAKEPTRRQPGTQMWQTIAAPQITFGLRDKMMTAPAYGAKYVVRIIGGKSTFVAERQGTKDGGFANAVFPEDFRDELTGSVGDWSPGCWDNKLAWEIYADGVLVDEGVLECRRVRLRGSKK